MNCSEVEKNLWRYVDRELPAQALAAVSSHLGACAACKQSYLEAAREANLCRTALVETPFGEAFVERFRQRLAVEAPVPAAAFARAPVGWPARQARGRVVRRSLTIAAMVLCIPAILGLGYYFSRPTLGSFFVHGGGVSLTRQGQAQSRRLLRGDLEPSDVFIVEGRGSLSCVLTAPDAAEESSLHVEGPARLRVESNTTAAEFRARLDFGVLHADVAKDPQRQVFQVRTPHAVAVVLGTQFSLEVAPDVTWLTVDEGEVAFYDADGKGSPARVTRKSGAAGRRQGSPEVVWRESGVAPGVVETGASSVPARASAEESVPAPADPPAGIAPVAPERAPRQASPAAGLDQPVEWGRGAQAAPDDR